MLDLRAHLGNHIPGLLITCPATPYDVKGLIKTAIRSNDPVCFFEHKLLYGTTGEVPEEDYTVPFGQAAIRRAGKVFNIVSLSSLNPDVNRLFMELYLKLMHGDSSLSRREREMLAVCVSQVNSCHY